MNDKRERFLIIGADAAGMSADFGHESSGMQ